MTELDKEVNVAENFVHSTFIFLVFGSTHDRWRFGWVVVSVNKVTTRLHAAEPSKYVTSHPGVLSSLSLASDRPQGAISNCKLRWSKQAHRIRSLAV